MFMTAIPEMEALNIMKLSSPVTAILSALIFNAIIIPLLVPLAMKGVAYKPVRSDILLRRNLLIYGIGGMLAAIALILVVYLCYVLLNPEKF